MSHLVGHVLPAPEPLWVDTDLGQEEVCSSQEVTESLVVDGTLQNQLGTFTMFSNLHWQRHPQ